LITKRIILNIALFLVATTALTMFGVYHLLLQGTGGDRITADFSDTGGLATRNDVTLRGVTVGSVDRVELTEDGARAYLVLDKGVEVPEGTTATIVRRSPLGDLVVELTPGTGEPIGNGGHIAMANTQPPPDAGKTVEVLARVLHSVPAEDLSTVVSELATAVEGRGDDLAELSEATADLPERILEVEAELNALIRTGPQVTGVLADNADVLADDITVTAQLADILRDRRFDIAELYRNGSRFTQVAGRVIERDKANISCLISDFADINSVIAKPNNRSNLAAALDLNHFFFDGVEQAVQQGLDGRMWFRVQLLPHTEPQARSYVPQGGEPDVYAANACRSRYGPGVGPGRQPHRLNMSRESEFHPGR
jgi:phospholipid/cholesterol/gamma-HCH transport system substrate-binding protein